MVKYFLSGCCSFGLAALTAITQNYMLTLVLLVAAIFLFSKCAVAVIEKSTAVPPQNPAE